MSAVVYAAPWQRMAVNTRSPYLDTDTFAPGTLLEYYVQHETQQGEPVARSHIASTALPYCPTVRFHLPHPIHVLVPNPVFRSVKVLLWAISWPLRKRKI
ncbi:hypothetical protein [Hymenobacter sp. BRD67]|uniref:hypothetical protein n=1 Tax=Hymenobacter sp. BRD67 TaxID=2675877 RepID=UPI0015646F19|nr:hypothetical protein [Hymenobacter sp. BRD67]QKG55141.1 hypothetical protein GKZ67_22240 [Hymenobacter sp. BRD67]